MQEVFASTGPVEACKLIRKEKVVLYFYFLFSFYSLEMHAVFFFNFRMNFADVSSASNIPFLVPLATFFVLLAVILWVYSLL